MTDLTKSTRSSRQEVLDWWTAPNGMLGVLSEVGGFGKVRDAGICHGIYELVMTNEWRKVPE